MASAITEIVIDCHNVSAVAEFWADALGWSLQRSEHHIWMSQSGEPATLDLKLVFVPVPEAKTVKNRVHIDLNPRGCDQDEEVMRLRHLGARPIDVGQGDAPWVVLADPEGNEFCVLRRRLD